MEPDAHARADQNPVGRPFEYAHDHENAEEVAMSSNDQNNSNSPRQGGGIFFSTTQVVTQIPVLILIQNAGNELVDYQYVDSDFAQAAIYAIEQRRALQTGNA